MNWKCDAPFTLANPWAFPRYGMPLRCSVPIPKGQVKDPTSDLVLLDEERVDAGAQWQVLSTWPDGSTRHALMNYAEPVIQPRQTRSYRLVSRERGVTAKPAG